jgi:primosomal protein N' (replication factor Y)
MPKYFQVALKVAHNNGIFCYAAPIDWCERKLLYCRVKVTLKNRSLTGLVVEELGPDFVPTYKVKNIDEVIDQEPIITSQQAALISFCSRYYFNDLGTCFHLAVPKNEVAYKAKKIKARVAPMKEIILSEQQNQVWENIRLNLGKAFLLQGITGSGKTLIYLKLAQEVLKRQQSVLFLVPEISLTSQLIARVEEHLGEPVSVIHSNITKAKKRDAINELLAGTCRVLVGARSGIFAPLKNLGLIVVDEEHDSSFKQDESPRYHGRDLALWRGHHEGATVVLGSATPSMESLLNVSKGKLTHLQLPERFHEHARLPEVTVIDLCERSRDVDFRGQDLSVSAGQKMCIVSRPLKEAMAKTLAQGLQVLLFLNQRGYAKFGVCYDCGNMLICPHCSVGLTLYQHRQIVMCHLCQYEESAHKPCRHCHNPQIKFLGLGTERLEEEVKTLFPEHAVVRLDRDVVRSQKRLEDTLQSMHDRTANILIGTQMVTKGHDFQHVGLVGVICADVALSIPDFRASEKTFQVLTQVAGRAGRYDDNGIALIQTFNPKHPSIHFAQTHNVVDFARYEMALRKSINMPPYRKSAIVRVEHTEAGVASELTYLAVEKLSRTKALEILGPAPSPIEKILNRFRFQCFLLADTHSLISRALQTLLQDPTFSKRISQHRARLIVDIDPQSLS